MPYLTSMEANLFMSYVMLSWKVIRTVLSSQHQRIRSSAPIQEWEQRFLDLLINPNDVGEGWSEVALDPDVKEAIRQLIHQPANTSMHSYGILKRGRIGGALLYGPPGTGKTHLARVLARESKAITICVSAADVENEYGGETERAIQGLFNLERMLSPCTILLNEADALFRSRNFSRELDKAVLRRVPSRIHIGLPSLKARQQIFQICLAEETLHPDFDLRHIVNGSQGYPDWDL
ncbi:MAG: hypothetical protein Q9181_001973 [Wetmoreana brouardii]